MRVGRGHVRWISGRMMWDSNGRSRGDWCSIDAPIGLRKWGTDVQPKQIKPGHGGPKLPPELAAGVLVPVWNPEGWARLQVSRTTGRERTEEIWHVQEGAAFEFRKALRDWMDEHGLRRTPPGIHRWPYPYFRDTDANRS